MTVQEEIRQRIERDALLARLRVKIDSGNATFADTSAYNNRAAEILGDVFSRRLPDISPAEREAICVELLQERYSDINSLLARVQRSLDEVIGLQLEPQHAPFNSERAHQIGRSTDDPTVSEETQQRRARSAPATATRAMHDDYTRTNADFRSNAGLKCYINREAVPGCCAWCSAMAGRYEYGEEPDDVYRRHDNCGCTVTFENGRKRQDVWSKREWEAPKEGAGAGDPVVFTAEQSAAAGAGEPVRLTREKASAVDDSEPVRFTQEQAKALQEQNGLTKLPNHDTMKAITVDDFELRTYGKGIFKEVEKAIFSGIQTAEKRSGAIVSDILITHIPPTKTGREAILTEIMPNGLLRMIFNEDVFAGLSLDDVNAIFNGTESILANSLEEAMIHESGHLKYMTGKNPSEVEKIHSDLAKEHIKGISKYAETDGAECIAEVEIMLYRGDEVPEDAMKLYRRYIKGA